MDKMLYVAMTGASQNTLAQRAHANNLANVSTNGFQRDLEQARSMLSFGFINELLQGIAQPAVRDYLHRHLQKVFSEAAPEATFAGAEAS